MFRFVFSLKLVLLLLLLPLYPAWGAEPVQGKISAAVAANFIQAFKELSRSFEAKSGVKVEATFSSTGNLYGQIINGAPYDLFLSADEVRPLRLHTDGLADKPLVYARGQAILWSADKAFCKATTWQDALKDTRIKKIAIANPVTAPYGAAAKAALIKAGLWDALQGKLVNAQDIAQSFQYASTAAVDAGFCALSASVSPKGKLGCFYIVEEAPPVIQSACVLKRTKSRAEVEKFAAYLLSAEAQAIKTKFGYR